MYFGLDFLMLFFALSSSFSPFVTGKKWKNLTSERRAEHPLAGQNTQQMSIYITLNHVVLVIYLIPEHLAG